MTNTIDINGLPYMRVGDITVATATTSVSFTGLDIGKDDDYLLVSDVVNSSASTTSYFIYANGNVTVANYYRQVLSAASTTVSASRNTGTDIAYATAGNKTNSIANIKLTNSGYFVWQSKVTDLYNTITSGIVNYFGTSTFTLTSITSLTITSSVASAIGVGSRFQLYKLVAEKVADIIVTTACTSVDITGLAITKDSEYMLVSDTISGSIVSNINLFPNNNTTLSNYYDQYIYADSTSVSSSRLNDAQIASTETGRKSFAVINIKLTNSGYFVFQAQRSNNYGGSTLSMLKHYITSIFTSTSITQLTITASVANAIGIGSRFTLYKLK